MNFGTDNSKVRTTVKIAHLCLSNFYVDDFGYQENELIRQHVAADHDVLVIASTETYGLDGKLTYTQPGQYIGSDGAKVIRLPYRSFLPQKVMRKLRMHPGVREELEAFNPDRILFHGTCGWELLATAAYARAHQDVKLYIDSHEDWNNSARGLISREILHRRYYGPILRRAESAAESVLCISLESIDFVADLYGVDRSRLEFFPLGGNIPDDDEYNNLRMTGRYSLGISDDEILLVQSGKQTRRKKLLDSLKAFRGNDNPRLKLVIAGVLDAEIKAEAQSYIEADDRITFLGWVDPESLTEILCAADIYLQPGTQSVTMQQSLCCRCAVAIDDVHAHSVYVAGNGWLLDTEITVEKMLQSAANAPLKEMSVKSYELARKLLDYRQLARRITEE